MGTVVSRINFAVTLIGAVLAGYILWQFLTIYANAFRFQDAVSSIAYRSLEVQKTPQEIRENVLAAAAILHLPVKKSDVDVYVAGNRLPEINIRYAQPIDLLFATTYMRCQVGVKTVHIWFSSKPDEQEASKAAPHPPARKHA